MYVWFFDRQFRNQLSFASSLFSIITSGFFHKLLYTSPSFVTIVFQCLRLKLILYPFGRAILIVSLFSNCCIKDVKYNIVFTITCMSVTVYHWLFGYQFPKVTELRNVTTSTVARLFCSKTWETGQHRLCSCPTLIVSWWRESNHSTTTYITNLTGS